MNKLINLRTVSAKMDHFGWFLVDGIFHHVDRLADNRFVTYAKLYPSNKNDDSPCENNYLGEGEFWLLDLICRAV